MIHLVPFIKFVPYKKSLAINCLKFLAKKKDIREEVRT